MSRISRTVAQEVAKKMTDKISEKVKNTDMEIARLLTEETIKILPKEVRALWDKYPRWLKTNTWRPFEIEGVGRYSLYLESLPTSGSNEVPEIKGALATKIQKLINKSVTLEEKRKKLLANIKSTLIKLGTYKKVKEAFPEAYVLLPEKPQEMVLAIPVDDIMKELKIAEK